MLDLDAEVQRQLVTGAMNLEGPLKIELRLAMRRQFSADVVRREDGFGIACAFQDFMTLLRLARQERSSTRTVAGV